MSFIDCRKRHFGLKMVMDCIKISADVIVNADIEDRLTTAGYDVLSHAFDLTPMALRDALKGKGKGHFVIVVDDSRESTLKQLLQKTTDLRALMPSCTFSIVGYDSWMAAGMDRYRNELHAADAHVFASSYFFPYTSDAIRFREDYQRWFRTDLLDCSPRMAPLGYDVAIGIPSFHFEILPLQYYGFVIILLIIYSILVEIIKKQYIKKNGEWL